jgi:hypothetical protein
VPRFIVSTYDPGSIRAVGAAAVCSGCGADCGRGVPATGCLTGAGRALSSTVVPESIKVMTTMMMASDATVPKISVPPPRRLMSGGSGSSGFLKAMSGA